MLRVGLHENIFILVLFAITTARSAQKLRVGRVSENTAIFCLRLMLHFSKFCTSMHISKFNGGYKPQSRYSTSILTCIRPDSDALKYSGLEKYPFLEWSHPRPFQEFKVSI